MKTSKKGIQHIAKWEGFRKFPYQDSGGKGAWTIGYGETNPVVIATFRKTGIPEPIARRLLRRRVRQAFEKPVNALNLALKAKGLPELPPHKYDMLVSLSYNKGPGTLVGTPLAAQLYQARWVEAMNEFRRYNKNAAGTKLIGLINRRREEASIFLHGYAKIPNGGPAGSADNNSRRFN